jgi:hypothetical protein
MPGFVWRDDRGSKQVIDGLNPQHPMLRLFKRRRWQLDGRRFIFSHEGCRCLQPRITAWTSRRGYKV